MADSGGDGAAAAAAAGKKLKDNIQLNFFSFTLFLVRPFSSSQTADTLL